MDSSVIDFDMRSEVGGSLISAKSTHCGQHHESICAISLLTEQIAPNGGNLLVNDNCAFHMWFGLSHYLLGELG